MMDPFHLYPNMDLLLGNMQKGQVAMAARSTRCLFPMN